MPSSISLCKTYESWGGTTLTPGAYLSKFGKGLLDAATYQIPRFRPSHFRQVDALCLHSEHLF